MPVVEQVRTLPVSDQEIRNALDVVMDPELDEPITDLGFVRSIEVSPDGAVAVHLRLPTSFCSPNFAYLMASDAKDAVNGVPGVTTVLVTLDDHHDSELINAGLAADAGYRGTFRHEAETDLDELRETFRRKAHIAASERCLTAWLRAHPDEPVERVGRVRLRDLPADGYTHALLRRRGALGLPVSPAALVMVDHTNNGYQPEQVSMALRRARSTRISIDGNAHFCRGLLTTRYPGSDQDQTTRSDGAEAAGRPTLPLTVLSPTDPPSVKLPR